MNQKLSTPPLPNSHAAKSSEADALEVVLADAPSGRSRARLPSPGPDLAAGVVIGTFVEFSSSGEPIVRWQGREGEQVSSARTVVPCCGLSAGVEVALAFLAGEARQPIILGILSRAEPPASLAPRLHATVDGDRLELSADREIVLRCGKASITLTRAGKVVIRGAYLISRSSGVNRIKGGSVQIN